MEVLCEGDKSRGGGRDENEMEEIRQVEEVMEIELEELEQEEEEQQQGISDNDVNE